MPARNLFNFDEGLGKFELLINEIPLLIDEISYPCIIINITNNKIVCINYLVTQITKFGNQDLSGEDIHSILKNFSNSEIVEKKKIDGLLKTKEGTEVTVSFELRFINKDSSKAAIRIFEKNKNYSDQDDFLEKLLHRLEILYQEMLKNEDFNFYQSMINLTLDSFNCRNVTLYESDKNGSQLKKYEQKSSPFPDSIPVIEDIRKKKIDQWNQGKRVLNEIHRTGRKEGYQSVVTIPLDVKPIKLLVLAFSVGNVDEGIRKEIDLYVGAVTQFYEIARGLFTLRKKNDLHKRNYEQASSFIENSNDAMIVVDEDKTITQINSKTMELLKYPKFEMIGSKLDNFIPLKSLSISSNNSSSEPGKELENVLIHDRFGNPVHVQVDVVDIKQADILNKVYIITDISSAISLKQSMKKIESQAAIGEAVADFAHEVKDPINNISTGLQLMRRGNLTGDESLNTIDRMQADCIRINDLMESVLSYSRHNAVNFKKVDVCVLLQRINRRFSNKFNKHKIKAHFSCKTQNAIVMGEMRSLDQVFTNIINNAIDAMKDEGGELSVVVNRDVNCPHSIEIKISDTGRGLPAELKGKMFEPYVTGKKKGTGLGLAIVKKIIDAHGGEITIESFTSGSIFTIILKKNLQEN